MLVRQLGLVLCRTNLDDARSRVADLLSGLVLVHLAVVNSHSDGVLDLARRALLDNLGLARLQVRVHPDLGLVRGLLSPFDLVGNRVSLGAHADDRVGRFLGALGGHGRLAGRLAVHDLLSRGHNLSTQHALLIDDLFARLQFRIEDDLGLERNRLLQLGHNLAVISLRAVLDDLLDRLLGHLLGGVHRGGVVLCSEVGGEFLLTVLTLLDNLHLTRLQFRVHAHDRVVRQRRNPGCLVGRLSRLGADSDDLLHRLLDGLLGDLRVARLGVDDVSLDRHLLLARLTFLSDLGLARLQARVVDDLHIVRNLSLNGLSVRAGGLGTNADDLLLWLLGALSVHLRITGRLAVDDLLSRGHNLSTKLTLLINLLLSLFKRVIEDDLGVERNRLLNLGHHSGVLSSRAVLNDLANRILGLLLLRGHRCLITLSGEVSRVGLLTRHALLDNLDLTRLQLRVRAGLNLERNLGSPRDLRRRLGRLGADLDDLINRLLDVLLLNGGLAIRLRVGDLLSHGDGLLTRLALSNSFRGASRQVRIKLDLHTERNLRLNSLLGLTSGLGTDADLRVLRRLGLLDVDARLAVRLAVLDLLGRGDGLFTRNALFVDNLLAGLKSVVVDVLDLERYLLGLLAGQFLIRDTWADLDDAGLGLLGYLRLAYRGLVALGGELSLVGPLAVLAFLNDLHLTRLERRVLANLGWVRDRERPFDVLRALGRLGADDNDLVLRLLGALPGAVLLHLFFARHALGFNLVLAGRNGVVVLILNVERNLTLRDVDDVHGSGGVVLRAVLVGHDDRNVNLVARLRGLRRGRDDVALVIQADDPVAVSRLHLVGRVAELVVLTRGLKALALRVDHERLVRSKVDAFRLFDANRRGSRTTRVDRLRRNNRLCFPVVRQLHHGGDRHQRGGAIRSGHSDVDGLLVTRLGVCWRGRGDNTGLRVNLVLPAVNFLFSDRGTVLIVTEGELGTLRCVLHLVVHGLVRASRLHRVGRGVVALENDDGALDFLRLVSVVVVRENRDVQDVALRSGARNRRGDLTSVLVNLDGPLTAIVLDGVLSLTVREGVALRRFVGRVTAQATLRNLRLE